MNALRAKIEQDLTKAFRAKEEILVGVLRLLKTALVNVEIEKRAKEGKREVELTDADIVGVVRRQVKNTEESLELFQQGKRDDLVQKAVKEIEILRQYLPAELDIEAVRRTVNKKIEELGRPGPEEFGRVMSEAMKELKGKAGGETVAKVVKELLIQCKI
ncbi:MAG: GatB/YqeY domain-containing protein [bacterium]|nr:GatB/YqeY domain-containing protein [bacterium]